MLFEDDDEHLSFMSEFIRGGAVAMSFVHLELAELCVQPPQLAVAATAAVTSTFFYVFTY